MSDTHPEPAEIAALDEDLLAQQEATVLREHLGHCADCAAVRADLAALRDELSAMPALTTPEDVAQRIDAALRAAGPPVAPHVSRETRAAPHSAPTAPARRLEAPRASRWQRLALAAVAAVVAVGLGTALLQNFQPSRSSDDAGMATDAQADSFADGADGADDTDGTDALEAEVRELLARSPGPLVNAPEEQAAPESTTEGQEEALAAPLPPCVTAAIGRQELPLAAEEDHYHGVPAYLVVLPDAADAGRVDAYVVDAACATAPGPATGEVLDRQNYPLD